MATVYKAYHAALDRYVALKVLHTAFGEDASFALRFEREAKLVAKLDHPNIVPIYDYSEHAGRRFLVMKYIEGETLKARLQRGPLSSQELNEIIVSVGAALAYAHKMGILHRDIKPSNVLLTPDGSIYLADFGLARIASAGESTLSGDMIMGTPQYISPEQAQGKKELDEGTDIYSFGVMLYEMVVGQVPFNADTPFSIIHDHIFTPLPLPRKINPDVPETVERVLLKALAKERADRYPDIATLVAAFQQAWADAGVPMKGTTITMPMKETSAKTGPATASKKSASTVKDKTATRQTISKKRNTTWMIVSLVGIAMLCCLFFVLASNRQKLFRPNRQSTATPTVAMVSTAVPSTANVVPPTDTPVPVPPTDTATPVPVPPTVSPAVDAAMKAVAANPTDPNANLQLSLAYWDSGQKIPAFEALNTAANLAPPDDRAFFMNAAQEFAKREAWIASAGMYLRAMKTLGLNSLPPTELEQAMHEAVYKASASPEMPQFLPFESIAKVDEPISLIARGRAALFAGDTVKAREFLKQVEAMNPSMPEIQLLTSEILFKEGNRDGAMKILSGLAADLGVPTWIRTQADQYMTQFQ
jgi:serine/threonine protein kinase